MSREQFEAWWVRGNDGLQPRSGWKDLRTDDGYNDEQIDMQYEGFKAAEEIYQRQQAAVVAENAGLNKSLDAICDAYENGQSDLLAEAIRKATSLSTPVTDAYLAEAREKTSGELVGYIDADYADMLKDGDIDKCYLHKECSEGAVPLYLGVELKNG